MRRKILFIVTLMAMLACILALSVSADAIKRFETDEFQEGDNITYLEGVNTDSYLTDTDRNVDITTYLDNEKYFARAVLQNADGTYTTYPAWYVFNLSYDWKGSYQYSTVDRLNALSDVTGETYEKADIIRIEYLEFNEEGLKIARTGTATPSEFPNARYVRIPSHFTGLSFFNGYNVEIIEIAPEAKMETIGKASLLNCYKLKEIILPNTVTTIAGEGINFYSKQSTSALKVLNLGASLTTLGAQNAIRNCTIPGIRVIVPATLDGSTYGSAYFPSTAVILFTGNKEQAEAFGFTAVISYAEYVANNEEAEAGTIVYGYSSCDAFYKSVHQDVTGYENSTCLGKCNACGYENVLVANPVHNLAYAFAGSEDGKIEVDYLANIYALNACTSCGRIEETVEIGILFTLNGYSYTQGAIMQSFKIDKDVIENYNKYAKAPIEYGILAASGSVANIYLNGFTDNVISVDFTNRSYDIMEMKVYGISENHYETKLYCCGYILVDGEIIYMDDGMADGAAAPSTVTYNLLANEAAVPNTPETTVPNDEEEEVA